MIEKHINYKKWDRKVNRNLGREKQKLLENMKILHLIINHLQNLIMPTYNKKPKTIKDMIMKDK